MVVCAYVPVERVYHYYDWLVTHNEYNWPKNVTKQIKILKTHWLYVGFVWVRNESLLLYLIPLSPLKLQCIQVYCYITVACGMYRSWLGCIWSRAMCYPVWDLDIQTTDSTQIWHSVTTSEIR